MQKNIYEQAQQVLHSNVFPITIRNRIHRMTIPSREYYVHQWNWDSATHAMGLIHFDESRAYEEITCLLEGQWENGLIPHIVFTPEEKGYFPGPLFWETKNVSQTDSFTSGITQPPLVSISAAYLYQYAKDRNKANKFIQSVLPRLMRYHRYLHDLRDPENSGLVSIIHPWESGTDNSPRWDKILETIHLDTIPRFVKESIRQNRVDNKKGEKTHRPRRKDYYRYIYLIYLYKTWGWDIEKILRDTPFAVKDVLFNAIWCRANSSLASLLEQTGDKKSAQTFRMWENQTRHALSKLWHEDQKVFATLSVSGNNPTFYYQNTIANFLPLYARAADKKQFFSLISQLVNPARYWTKFPIPSMGMSDEKFEPTRYWRGPTWPITNMFIIEGLLEYSKYPVAVSLAKTIIQKTLAMIEAYGFFEYYHPESGKNVSVEKGIGFGSFSWSAAVYIYLLKTYGITRQDESTLVG